RHLSPAWTRRHHAPSTSRSLDPRFSSRLRKDYPGSITIEAGGNQCLARCPRVIRGHAVPDLAATYPSFCRDRHRRRRDRISLSRTDGRGKYRNAFALFESLVPPPHLPDYAGRLGDLEQQGG